MPTDYDAIIIGTGQAGPPLAERLTAAGRKVAVIERLAFGGTCVNNGCIPTKTMVASAYAAHLARRGADFGVITGGPVTVDMARVKARKDGVVGNSSRGVEAWVRRLEGGTVYLGHARFESPDTVRVGDAVLRAAQIFINVGGRAATPPMPGLDQVDYLTNTGMMRVDQLPRHLLVVGGSYIGLEFGQMFRRFGSEVTIVQRGPRLIEREDPEVSEAVRDILAAEGIGLRLDAECIALEQRGGEVVVKMDCVHGAPEIAGSHVLLAVGRRPNTDDLGLDRAGVATDAHGYIQVDTQLRTNVPGIWALGDCNGRGAFTHTAYNDFEIVAANLLDTASGEPPRTVDDRIPAYALFTDPPLGRVGMTEHEARQSGRRVLVGTRPMTRVGRAVEKGETLGFMKILVDADSREILGAMVLGVGGDEVIHCILDTMYARAPYAVLQRAMHIHPTVAELVPTMLGELRPLAPVA
ncbi:FAD-containing oxidoreductase [Cupriavidus sp. 2TAF22]|uniref:FAD-containing oxidoreductase n=1 Tax=unclassified Cupriavidus TaxID=2640874 RepID=UPI003F8F6671